MSSGYFEMKVNERRSELFDRIMDVVEPLIGYSSKTRSIEESARLGTKYIERMRDKKKQLEEIDRDIEKLREQKQEIRENWETKEISFEDL